MKTDRYYRTAMFVTIAALAMLSKGCHDPFMYNFVRGCGNLTTETRETGEFNSVDLKIPADVIIYRDDMPSLLIEADRSLMPYIAADMAGKTLYLQGRKNLRPGRNRITVYIGMPSVSSLRVSGSGNITVEDVFDADNLELKIFGSGNITVPVSTSRLSSEINGSGSLHLEGTAGKHIITIKGSGNVKSMRLESKNCEIKVMGSGNSYVRVDSALNAEIAGSGDIYVSGSPRINARINGTGKIIELPEK